MARILVEKNATPEEVKEALKSIEKKKKGKSIAKHFGGLKRGLDGLDYQKEVRNEWK